MYLLTEFYLMFCSGNFTRLYRELRSQDNLDETVMKGHLGWFFFWLVVVLGLVAYFFVWLQPQPDPNLQNLMETGRGNDLAAGGILFIGLCFGVMNIRRLEKPLLACSDGRVIDGYVRERRYVEHRDRDNTTHRFYQLFFAYMAQGKSYRLQETSTDSVYPHLREGDLIDIIYARCDPSIAYLYNEEQFHNHCLRKDKRLMTFRD
ncbi:hypothetical protein O4H49_03155 [Kiloniella laminariae]|uniref:DUF3592 domain-containing protein n=1 Tax=Kiloniella laminariae TaxID=454162 RepID=A0ABT4LF76_9PROT|nr:hypothetical protein [Kiloniella laminariae]MCZ4279761.1 hypothetical protein [Kiloniella laminariae]